MASYTVHQAPVAAHTVTAAYAPAAATVAVARPAPVAVAAAATAAAYGGYPTAHAATDYGYTQRQQEAPPPPPPVTTQNYQVCLKKNYYCFMVFKLCVKRKRPVWVRECNGIYIFSFYEKLCSNYSVAKTDGVK